MLDTLSQLVRKPSKVSEKDLEITGWKHKQSKVLDYMREDQELQNLLGEFKTVNDQLKYIRSKRDVKIYFTEQEKGGESYTYARCMFNVNGRPREFRKYLGKTDEIDPNKIDLNHLEKIFLRMLKNYLEY